MSDKRKQRWHERGFDTYKQAYAFFRKIVCDAADAGLQPKQLLPSHLNNMLAWLVANYAVAQVPQGIRGFTLCSNGRKNRGKHSNLSLAALGNDGVEHPSD